MEKNINKASMLRVGTILRGIYRIDSYLSSGGFGNTYVATNIEFNERYAIKEFFMKGVTQRDDNNTTVSVSNSENEANFLQQKEKFKKEARRLRQLKNSHIVSVYDLFEENGTAYYVMDYIDGENLSERMKRTGRSMTEEEVSNLLPQLLDALKVIHDANMLHLDLKPANIMVDKNSHVKLIDFGASKQLDSQTGGATATTAISYTNGYAPREQMEQNYDKFGPWTDIYALGATLYNLLTNKRPPLPSDIDDDLSEDKHIALPFPESVGGMKFLVLQLMKTNRLQRPQNVDAIIAAENTKTVNPKHGPKQQPLSQSPTAYDDEATIISDPRTKKQSTDPITDDTSSCYAEKSSITSNADTLTSTEDSNDTKSGGKQIIDYVKQPFRRAFLTFMALSISLCVAIILIPDLFFILGEYSFDQESLTIGNLVLSDLSTLIMIANYLFIILSIVWLVPLIIGFLNVNPYLAYLLILVCVLSISNFVEYILIKEETLLNWILFYGEHLVLIVLGILIIWKYRGRIRALGLLLTIYSLLCSLLNILVFPIGIGFETYTQIGCYEVFVWGIDLLQVWGIWWFLARKEVVNESN